MAGDWTLSCGHTIPGLEHDRPDVLPSRPNVRAPGRRLRPAPIYWLSKHLGHSSLDVTDRVYGHMEAATRQREAREMAGVFGV